LIGDRGKTKRGHLRIRKKPKTLTFREYALPNNF
jgi:hypothetical protein